MNNWYVYNINGDIEADNLTQQDAEMFVAELRIADPDGGGNCAQQI